MPTNDVPMHPTDGASWMQNIHDHFETGNGSADALSKAHQRMSSFGVSFAAAGSSMTVSNLTTSIRNHMERHGMGDCGCEDENEYSYACEDDDDNDEKNCSGSKSRQRTMRKKKKSKSFDMSSLNQAMVETDKWFSAHLAELKE